MSKKEQYIILTADLCVGLSKGTRLELIEENKKTRTAVARTEKGSRVGGIPRTRYTYENGNNSE